MTADKKTTLQVSDGSTMDAYISIPEGPGPFPAIMIFQEAYGVNNHIRKVADRFAQEGYVAIAPELFHRTAVGFEALYTDFASAAPHLQAVNVKDLSADIKATYQWLQEQKNVIGDKIGSVGYCMGGRASFLANIVVPVKAAVSYYGGGIITLLDRVKELHAPHFFLWGGLDKHIPAEQVEEVKKAMNEDGKKYSSITFPDADHGFNNNERSSYHAKSSDEAWEMIVNFFLQLLKLS
jgi:carboxymethylenebutenolidase